jgi:hypothetical protein
MRLIVLRETVQKALPNKNPRWGEAGGKRATVTVKKK